MVKVTMLGARVLSRKQTKRVMVEFQVEGGLSQRENMEMEIGTIVIVENQDILKEIAKN